MFWVLCILPLALSAPLETTLDDYKLYIEEDPARILKNVEFKSGEVPELDLSNMNLYRIDDNALDNVRSIKSLNLSNNTIDALPTSVFSSLTNLEYLSLANNDLQYLDNQFTDLKNLRTLDISNNPLSEIHIGESSGLSKSVTIITMNNNIGTISNVKPPKEPITEPDEPKSTTDNAFAIRITPVHNNLAQLSTQLTHIKLCTTDGIVTLLTVVGPDEDLPAGCISMTYSQQGFVYLPKLGIRGFQKGWPKIDLSSIFHLSWSFNNITTITEDTLNDLPAHITHIEFNNNQIKHIHKEVIKNNYLKLLNLEYNGLEYIEAGAFANTNLEILRLTGNKIADLAFTSSLPQSLKFLHLSQNEITSIPDRAFANLRQLNELLLESNQISRLQTGALDNLSSLVTLTLTSNKITDIQPGVFKDLAKLETLLCGQNHIVSVPSGLWSPLKSLQQLHLDGNRIKKLTRESFGNLPKTLDVLFLSTNDISDIESGSFNESPQMLLDLSENKIDNIPRGALNLPKLAHLYLANNKLSVIDPDSYENLRELQVLFLAENEISDIVKGACKNFGKLDNLDISMNPLKELKNGALYGLNKEGEEHVTVIGNSLEKIQGGAFEDV